MYLNRTEEKEKLEYTKRCIANKKLQLKFGVHIRDYGCVFLLQIWSYCLSAKQLLRRTHLRRANMIFLSCILGYVLGNFEGRYKNPEFDTHVSQSLFFSPLPIFSYYIFLCSKLTSSMYRCYHLPSNNCNLFTLFLYYFSRKQNCLILLFPN